MKWFRFHFHKWVTLDRGVYPTPQKCVKCNKFRMGY